MVLLNTPLQLGTLQLPNRVFYSPLAGCSDYPFRQQLLRRGRRPALFFTEMVKMDALVRGDGSTFHLLDYDPSMHPIGAQLCGSQVAYAAPAARILESLGYAVIDLNCGCPVDKVTRDGSGSALLRDPQKIGDLISEMVAAVSVPVTLKIRAGWEEGELLAPQIAQIAEEAGAASICVHGRTRAQGYRGPADWSTIRATREAVRSIVVIGNGDVMDPQAAQRMVAETGCDAVMASRGTLGRPWLAEDIFRAEEGLPPLEASPEICRQALLDHLDLILAYSPPRKALLDLRRVGCWYLQGCAGAREFRARISQIEDVQEAKQWIAEFPFGASSIAAAPVDGEDCCS